MIDSAQGTKRIFLIFDFSSFLFSPGDALPIFFYFFFAAAAIRATAVKRMRRRASSFDILAMCQCVYL